MMPSNLYPRLCLFSTLAGLSLVELMVAMLLGSVLMIAATQLWVSHGRIYHLLTDASTIQESGRFGLYFLTTDLQLAGHGLEHSSSAIDWGVTKEAKPASLSGDNDELGLNRMSTSGDYNCLGVSVVPNTRLSSHYYVKDQRLICRTEYWAYSDEKQTKPVKKSMAHAIIEGVDSFQLLYGVGNPQGIPGEEQYDEGNSFVVAYLTADQVNPDLHKVLSVRLGFLVSSDLSFLKKNHDDMVMNASLHLLDREYPSSQDGKIRHRFETTVVLRNVRRSLIATNG